MSSCLKAHLQQWTGAAVNAHAVACSVATLMGHEVCYEAQVTRVHSNAISTKHRLQQTNSEQVASELTQNFHTQRMSVCQHTW